MCFLVVYVIAIVSLAHTVKPVLHWCQKWNFKPKVITLVLWDGKTVNGTPKTMIKQFLQALRGRKSRGLCEFGALFLNKLKG